MWFKEYRDYETDKPLIKDQVEPGKGIIGCEMHDLNGWGNTIHETFPRKVKGFFATLISRIFGGKSE
ncbi:MAG: hypothetical protein H0W88_10320 [Parachlamydiaceae bacterium]|nr:hypothetical protein [Parachlamydiaceae bacterium]